MKILYFTPYYPPQSEAAATRSFWFIKTLQEAGHSVEIFTTSNMYLKLASNKEGALKRLMKENLLGIELFFRLLGSSGDRVVLSSPPFFTVCWGALAAIITRKKFILDVRDLYPEVFFEMGLVNPNSFFGKLARRITRLMYQKALGIMTVTQGLVNEISSYGIGHSKIVLARNGYDSELFYPGKPEEKFEKFTLVFHGTLGKAQNIETLLKLARELEEHKDIEIVVAGDGPKLKEILEAKRKNIRYVGKLSYKDIPELLRKCHVGLSFRTDDKIGKEAFPVKVFEYIGCGLLVVLSPKSEAGEIVEKEKLGREFENCQLNEMKSYIIESRSLNFNYFTRSDFSRSKVAKKIVSIL